MDARQALLAQHAHIHAAATSGADRFSLEDGVCDGLTAEQLRSRPGGLNSIVWLLWHMTRFEDVVVNTVLRGVPEVLDQAGWLDRLGIETRLIGTGSSDDEVAELSRQVDPAVVRAYRSAVGRATRLWLRDVHLDSLDVTPDVVARLAQAPAAISTRAAWVQRLWSGHTAHELLLLPVIGHSYIHFGEARATRARLGAPVP